MSPPGKHYSPLYLTHMHAILQQASIWSTIMVLLQQPKYEALVEIKIYKTCKTQYTHNNNDTNKPPECQAHRIISTYNNKFKKSGRKFAADIVGSGNSNIVGPVELAQSCF